MTEPTLPPEPGKDATADELEADIAGTRQRLGETIDALEDKLNMSAQAKRKVDQTNNQLTDKVAATKAQALDKVTAVRTQVNDTVSHATAQVTDKLGQATAKGCRAGTGATDLPAAEAVDEAEDQGEDSSFEADKVTWTAEGGPITAGVPGQVKNITTRLANKVNQARSRTKATGTDGDTAATRVGTDDASRFGSPEAAEGVGSTGTGWTSTAAAVTGKVSRTAGHHPSRASQFTTRVRQNPRSALPAAAAVLAGVVWLTWRLTHAQPSGSSLASPDTRRLDRTITRQPSASILSGRWCVVSGRPIGTQRTASPFRKTTATTSTS